MKKNGDRLDEAIELVSARMTAVEADAGLAARIANALPGRRVGLTWILAGWAPRLAVLAIAAVAITVFLRMFYERSTEVLRTEGATMAPTIVEPPSNDLRTIVEPPLIVRSRFVEPSSNLRRTTVEVRPDHEFSLPAMAAPEEIAVSSLSAGDLPADEALVIAPLEIAELPLTAEFPPR